MIADIDQVNNVRQVSLNDRFMHLASKFIYSFEGNL